MNKILFSLIFVGLFLVYSISVYAQKSIESSVLLNKKRASVYIEFERSGKEQPLFEGESNQRIWLNLQNNSKWAIIFCSFSVEKKYGDLGVVYDVKRLNQIGGTFTTEQLAQIEREMQNPIPEGYSTADTCSEFELASGKSVLFSIPKEHLKKRLYIQIKFSYEWEIKYPESGGTPSNYVFFGYSSLPSNERAN